MTLSRFRDIDLKPAVLVFFPLVLWGMVWLGLSSGLPGSFFNPGSIGGFVSNIRSILPLIAACVGLAVIVMRVWRYRAPGVSFISPLGLVAAYGLVGVLATIVSPDEKLALYWSAIYVAVPITLWAAVWGPTPLVHLQRLVNVTWAVVILITAILFTLAVFKLGLSSIFTDPSTFLECKAAGWFDFTSGRLRETGVGRYAAIAALIAFTSLWQRNLRWLWAIIFIASLALLLSTGARGSFLGFAAGILVVILAYRSKRTLVGGLIAVAVIVPVFWITGVHQTFLDNCIARNWVNLDTPAEDIPVLATVAPDTTPIESEVSINGGNSGSGSTPTSANTSQAPQTIESEVSINGGNSGSGSTPTSANTSQAPQTIEQKPLLPTEGFYAFTGRTLVWERGLELFQKSPLLGYGFHADRLLIGQHLHNAVLHAMVQTGLLGTIPFVAGILFAWFLVLKGFRNLSGMSAANQRMTVQVGAVLGFLSARAFPESSGAFFGVDWLLLALILLFLQVVNSADSHEAQE